MNYGSSSYGSAALGGASANQWFTFFVYKIYAADVLLTSTLELGVSSGLFSVFSAQGNESGEGILYQVFTSNDPGETPQLQVTFAGIGQSVVGAAQFVTVTVQIDGAVWPGGMNFSVRGRLGD